MKSSVIEIQLLVDDPVHRGKFQFKLWTSHLNNRAIPGWNFHHETHFAHHLSPIPVKRLLLCFVECNLLWISQCGLQIMASQVVTTPSWAPMSNPNVWNPNIWIAYRRQPAGIELIKCKNCCNGALEEHRLKSFIQELRPKNFFGEQFADEGEMLKKRNKWCWNDAEMMLLIVIAVIRLNNK